MVSQSKNYEMVKYRLPRFLAHGVELMTWLYIQCFSFNLSCKLRRRWPYSFLHHTTRCFNCFNLHHKNTRQEISD